MTNVKKIVLPGRNGGTPRLVPLVEGFIRDGVIFVGVVGQDCARGGDLIDEIAVGAGDRDHDLPTSSHANKGMEAAVHCAGSLTGQYAGEVQVVEL